MGASLPLMLHHLMPCSMTLAAVHDVVSGAFGNCLHVCFSPIALSACSRLPSCLALCIAVLQPPS